MNMEQNISNWVTYLIRKKIHIIVTSSVLLVCLVVKKIKENVLGFNWYLLTSLIMLQKKEWKGDVPNYPKQYKLGLVI